MTPDLPEHRNRIALSRRAVLAELDGVSPSQGAWREAEGSWSLQEVVEHLVLAERGGFHLIWAAAEAYRAGTPVWTGDSQNAGRSIEEIIAATWQTKERAPPSAEPEGKWSLGAWASQLRSCDAPLEDLARHLEGLPLDRVIYPHFLSGPLDALQRLEFIRFHMDHHLPQIRRIRAAVIRARVP